MEKNYLRPLATDVPVGAALGTEKMDMGLFPGGIYGLKFPPHVAKPTPAMTATVYELALNGKFIEIYGSLGKDRLRWTRSQVARYLRDNTDHIESGECSTFFELEEGLVARVIFVGAGGFMLMLNVLNLFNEAIWYEDNHHRFIILQPQPKPRA